MSDTPRIDSMRGFATTSHHGASKSYDLICDEGGPFVHAELARQIERECNELRRELADARKALQQIVSGGYAAGADVAHPAVGLARRALSEINAARESAESSTGKGGA